MPPKGKSKALVQKQSYLGKFTQNARNLEQMKVLIQNQEKEKSELECKLRENKVIIQQKQSQLKSSSRKLAYRTAKIRHVNNQLKLSTIHSKLDKLAFSISCNVKSQRKKKPTSSSISYMAKSVRRSQTYQACSAIHGASDNNLDPLLTGMIDMLTSKVKCSRLAKSILTAKPALVKEIEKTVLSKWKSEYYKSEENILRSLNIYYSHDVMGKAKYRAIRKANKKDPKVPNYVQYTTLAEYINNLDIGTIYDVQERYNSSLEEPVDGTCRSLSQYALRLVKFYLSVNQFRHDKLLQFKGKEDPSSLVFLMAIGGDGAPGSGTAFLISFINVGARIASSSENFLLFGANTVENSYVCRKFILELVSDIRFLESQTFDIKISDEEVFKVEFKLSEIPNDMKMLCFLGGELTNAAYYFSTFANVNKDTCYDFTKKIGDGEGDWRPFNYKKRLEDAEKVKIKAEVLSKGKGTKQTKRSNLTNYVGKVLKSRQEEAPLISNYIDCAKAEPLHLKNNVTKEMFMKLLHICFSQLHSNPKSFSEIPEDKLIVCFLKFVRKEMGCNFLAKKVIQWFNEKGGKLDSDFSFRFRGKESYLLLKHFPELISLILNKVSVDQSVVTMVHKIHFQMIQLRKVVSFSVRIINFDENSLREMNDACSILYKACCVTDNRVSPSLWTLCCAAPYHAKITLDEYRLGLGVNTMEGREQKHQMITKYANNTTYQNRWPMIFRHEYIQLIYLRENGFDDNTYKRRGKSYLPEIMENDCQKCGLRLVSSNCCGICDSGVMKSFENELRN